MNTIDVVLIPYLVFAMAAGGLGLLGVAVGIGDEDRDIVVSSLYLIVGAPLWPLALLAHHLEKSEAFRLPFTEEARLERRKRRIERDARLLLKRAEVEKLETEYHAALDRWVGSA